MADAPGTESQRILRNSGTVTFFTFLSRLLGAARDLVIAHFFGAGGLTDAFIQAFTIPNVFRRLTAEGSLTLAFLPLYTEIREKRGRPAARIFASQTLGLVLVVTLAITALGMVFAPQLVYLFAAGFADDPEQFGLTVELTRWMFPYLMLVSVVAWAMGVLNAEQRFAAPAAAPILLNVAIVASALAVAPMLEQPIFALAYGVLAGGFAQVLLQLPALCGAGQPLAPQSFGKAPDLQRLLRLLGPSLFGVAVYQINLIVLRNLASFLPSGQVTHYYNASRLTELTLGVFAFAIANASLPELSKHTAQADWEQARKTLRFSAATTGLIIWPAALGLAAAAEPIISMLYRHGSYTLEDVRSTTQALQAFALGLPAVALVRLQTSACYALQDTKTPVRIAAFGLALTAGLGWHWSQTLEVTGLALGLSAGTWVQAVLLAFGLRRHSRLQGALPWLDFLRQLAAALAMGLLTAYVSLQWDWNSGPANATNWAVFLGLLLGAALFYFAAVLVLRDPHAHSLLRLALQKVRPS